MQYSVGRAGCVFVIRVAKLATESGFCSSPTSGLAPSYNPVQPLQTKPCIVLDVKFTLTFARYSELDFRCLTDTEDHIT